MSTIFQALDLKAGLIPEAAPARPAGASSAAPVTLRDAESAIRVEQIQLGDSSPLLPYDGSSPGPASNIARCARI